MISLIRVISVKPLNSMVYITTYKVEDTCFIEHIELSTMVGTEHSFKSLAIMMVYQRNNLNVIANLVRYYNQKRQYLIVDYHLSIYKENVDLFIKNYIDTDMKFININPYYNRNNFVSKYKPALIARLKHPSIIVESV